MRQVNQLGLTADVACMTGGGIGQLANLIPYDTPHAEVVINAGSNDIRHGTVQEFMYTVTKTEEKIKKLQETMKVSLILPGVETSGAEEQAKREYLATKLGEMENLLLFQPDNIDSEDGVHPTVDGTKELIVQINNVHNNELTLTDNLEDVVSKAKYKRVDAVFKVGCRGCDREEYTAYLCDDCKLAAKSIDPQPLQRRIEEIRKTMFPDIPMGSTPVDNQSMKRGLDANENEDDKNPNKKINATGKT